MYEMRHPDRAATPLGQVGPGFKGNGRPGVFFICLHLDLGYSMSEELEYVSPFQTYCRSFRFFNSWYRLVEL